MLLMTTTPTVEGRSVRTYLGIVSGESAIEFDWAGRASSQAIHDTRVAAMAEMSARAQKMGASAIVGVTFDIEALSPAVKMVMATGTAVVL